MLLLVLSSSIVVEVVLDRGQLLVRYRVCAGSIFCLMICRAHWSPVMAGQVAQPKTPTVLDSPSRGLIQTDAGYCGDGKQDTVLFFCFDFFLSTFYVYGMRKGEDIPMTGVL